MGHHVASVVMGMLCLGLLVPGSVWADAETMEGQLKEAQRAIEKAAALHGNEAFHVTALAEQLQVPASIIQELRNEGRRWGELATELALAQQLVAADPGVYPTVAEAVRRVEGLQADEEDWGAVARELDVSLASALRRTTRAQSAFHAILPTTLEMGGDEWRPAAVQLHQLARVERAGLLQTPLAGLPAPDRAAHGIR